MKQFRKIIFLGLVMILSACTNSHIITQSPDGSKTEATIMSLWSNPTISGFDAGSSNGNQSKHLKVDSFTDDRISGLESFNKMLPGLVESAVLGAVKGAGLAAGKP